METKSNKNRHPIKVWLPQDLTQLELHRGFSVARPVPRHWHDEYQLCLVESGKGDLIYRGTNFLTPPSSLFIVHPGEVHSNRAFDNLGCSYRTIFLPPEIMQNTAAEAQGKKADQPFFPTTVIFDKEIIGRFLNLHSALEQSSSSLERQTLLLNFLNKLIDRFADSRPSPHPFGLERKAVKQACDYLSEHYAENISLEKLASIANLSPFHFNRVFSEQVGMPPHAFQTQLRVSRAKSLLRQGRALTHIALETGFFDQSHLNRHFKRLTGVTVGQYRNSKNVLY
jgi:AraC-like DNA-binding protein